MDYGDFEYQQVEITDEIFSPSSGGNSLVQFDFDPLEARGGLDSDQYAELVGYRLHISANTDDEAGATGNVQAFVSYNFGIDLSENETPAGKGLDDSRGTVLNDSTGRDEVTGIRFGDVVEPGLLSHAHITFSALSAGAGPQNNTYVEEENYRHDTGRGPILDYDDSLTILSRQQTKESIGTDVYYHLTLIWDVGTAENQRKRFSTPS